jgi:hypothetical protein
MTDYEKVIKIHEKSLIPADIVQSDLTLQSYLVENVKENKKHELIRQRIAKAQHTRINHALEAAARKITVEPTQKTKTWKCKKVAETNDFNLNPSAQAQTNEPAEGSLVIEQIKGIIVVCNFCGHGWTHHSKNLGRQYYTQCGFCRRNVRLKHYQ